MTEPTIIKPEDINPNYKWHRRVPSHGRTNVDYEERINFPRLHKYRLGRARQALKKSRAGSLLCFDNNNIRYLTSTVIGEWSRDKICRYSLLAQDHDPILWDFGSAAKHHQIFSPWLPKENWKAGMVGLRGTVHPDAGLMKNAAKEIKSMLDLCIRNLEEISFFKPREKKPIMLENLRNIFYRMDLSDKETRILSSVFASLAKKR